MRTRYYGGFINGRGEWRLLASAIGPAEARQS